MVSEKTDKLGYNQFYKDKPSPLIRCHSVNEYLMEEKKNLVPFYQYGHSKGYVRGMTVELLLEAIQKSGKDVDNITLLDAGCGQGELSVYLACLGYRVIGVDISEQARDASVALAEKVGVAERCSFLAASLESIPVDDQSIDFIIGHASLHHFIKYDRIPNEFDRVLTGGGEMFFADSFGENILYHLFHNKEEMNRLGDVILTKKKIEVFFHGFDVTLIPTDWLTMLDKLLLKFLPEAWVKKPSRVFWQMDRWIPNNRLTLCLSGTVLSRVKKRS